MNKDLIAIFEYLEREKGIKREIVVSAIEESLLTAARKTMNAGDNISVHIDMKTGEIEVLTRKNIVEKVQNPKEEISLEIAQELAPGCEIGQRLELSITPEDFGRIAAQIARQVISQKLRGAERDVIYEEYRHRVNEIISGTVKRFLRNRTMVVDLGKVEAVLPDRNYPKMEKYQVGEKVQALLEEVHDTENGGAEVILSRNSPEFVKQLFLQEVPELSEGTVIIEKIVREPGYRTKMVVRSSDLKVDPVGTCVGIRGTRIKNIIREINNEKIDVIPYSEDFKTLLNSSISPVEAKRVKITADRVFILVTDDDYPTVIGKKGMNARLLSILFDKEVVVQKITEYQTYRSIQMMELADSREPALKDPLKNVGLSTLIQHSLEAAGYDSIIKICSTKPDDLVLSAPGLNYLDLADKIFEYIEEKRNNLG